MFTYCLRNCNKGNFRKEQWSALKFMEERLKKQSPMEKSGLILSDDLPQETLVLHGL
jgi:hypothetical protein